MATSTKMTKKKYNKILKESNEQVRSDYPDAGDEVWSDFAQVVLDNEPGIKEFIQRELRASDFLGRLTDDISGPNILR